MAISKLESVPVDTSKLKFVFVGQKPAVRKENGVEVPKVRDGRQGIDVDLLAKFDGDSDRSTVKLTIYADLPPLSDYESVHVKNLRANVWTDRAKPGGGMWFSADGVDRISAPRQASKSEATS